MGFTDLCKCTHRALGCECRPLQGGYECTSLTNEDRERHLSRTKTATKTAPIQWDLQTFASGKSALWVQTLARWLWVHLQRSVKPIALCKCTPLGAWGRRGCTRFQIPCLLCLNENSFLPAIGYSAVDSPIEIKICTNFSNFVIIHMHICRNPRTYVEPTRRVVYEHSRKDCVRRKDCVWVAKVCTVSRNCTHLSVHTKGVPTKTVHTKGVYSLYTPKLYTPKVCTVSRNCTHLCNCTHQRCLWKPQSLRLCSCKHMSCKGV